MPRSVTRWALAAFTLALLIAVVFLTAGPYRTGRGGTFDLANLTPDDRAQLTELVLNVSEAPEETLVEAHDGVWKILRRYGNPSSAARKELEQLFMQIGRGTHLFWLDAQRALAEGAPVKSGERTQWEADLLSSRWLTMEQQRRYDTFMERIAREEPLESSHGVEIAIDEQIVDKIVESWNDAEWRATVAALLKPPAA